MKQSLFPRVALCALAVGSTASSVYAQVYRCEATVSSTGSAFQIASVPFVTPLIEEEQKGICEKWFFNAVVSTVPKVGQVNWFPCDSGDGRISLEFVNANGSFMTTMRLWDRFQQKIIGESTVYGNTMLPWKITQRLTARTDYDRTVLAAVDCSL